MGHYDLEPIDNTYAIPVQTIQKHFPHIYDPTQEPKWRLLKTNKKEYADNNYWKDPTSPDKYNLKDLMEDMA